MYRTYSKFVFHTSKLHYSAYGEGEKVLLMFHGFGHTHKNMREIEEALASDYKIYNFDLFFHGFSEWNHGDSPLSHDYWSRLIFKFLEEHNVTKFSVLGFSLGAKVALTSVELFADRIDNLYLLAPDGLKQNIWYNVATSKLLRGVFRSVILSPNLFYKLIKLLGRFNLLDKSTVRFSSIQMNSREKRRRVYYTWTVYKGIAPHVGAVVDAINLYNIHTEVFVGRYDRIIRVEQVKEFADRLHKKQFNVMNSGHNNLLDEVAFYLEKEVDKR